jgi:hypothetical protein
LDWLDLLGAPTQGQSDPSDDPLRLAAQDLGRQPTTF